MLMLIRRFEFLILLGIFTTVPGNVNVSRAMRLTSFGNEMPKADSQSANIPSPLRYLFAILAITPPVRRHYYYHTLGYRFAILAITPPVRRHYGLS